jgi:ribosome-binding protein aMBF1 (putative translation factor)
MENIRSCSICSLLSTFFDLQPKRWVGGPALGSDLNGNPLAEAIVTHHAMRNPTEMSPKTKAPRDPRRDELRRLGERVREQRRSRGLTQEALAESLDLSVAYVSLIERGGRNPPYTTVVAIARALGVPPSSIVVDD